DSDHEARVEEAVVRTVVCAFKSAEGAGSSGDWLNPTEDEATTYRTNLQYVNMAVTAATVHKMAEKVTAGNLRDQEQPLSRRKELNREVEDESGTGTALTTYLVPVFPSLTNEESQHKETQPATPREETAITSNELLDCLLHPEVITKVAQLLLSRRIGKS
ncbi:hypothetical protein GDO81_029083, partial [Engystomops pustulosus]